jgi:hypothetical protein
MFSISSNKRRLYIAYLHRAPTEANPLRFHTALLVAPKNPDTTSDKKSSRLFHVVNRIDNSTKEDTWYFEPREMRTRTPKLAGVMLLGKIQNGISNDDIENMLANVRRQHFVREDPSWRCRHWVWEALAVCPVILSPPCRCGLIIDQVLISQNVIPVLPANPKEVWQVGVDFAETQPPVGPDDAIPCCNTAGNPDIREIGPM